MSIHNDSDWAEDHGYYHWKCRDCHESGWTDTSPDCACRRAEEADAREIEKAEAEDDSDE